METKMGNGQPVFTDAATQSSVLKNKCSGNFGQNLCRKFFFIFNKVGKTPVA